MLAESGVRPTDGRWGRGAHLVCGWLTLQGLLAPQGEFTFGVPQFRLLFSPILVCLAAGIGLVALRIVHGRFWMLGLVAVNFGIQATGFLDFGGDDSPVDTRFGATFLVSAVVVELLAWVLGTEDRTRFALASGLGIGTLGLGGEYLWNTERPAALDPATCSPRPSCTASSPPSAPPCSGPPSPAPSSGTGPGAPSPACSSSAPRWPASAVIVVPLRRPTGDVTAAVQASSRPDRRDGRRSRPP